MKHFASRGILPRLWFSRLGAVLALISATASADVVSFPGALGYGSATTGARGGAVYHVTNLNDSGAGSFRDAVSANGRMVVFDVGGYIHALTPISVKSNITIAGQTAPGDGIGVYGAEVSYSGSSNDITRYFRFRDGTQDPNYPGSSSTNSHTNCIGLYSTTNMIFDHCSMEFAAYNNVDAVDAVNLTFQSCIFADPIKEQQFNCHFETGPATFINNLWANAHNRNPLGKGNLQYLDNVIYNFQGGFTSGNTSGHFLYDIINNYFITGPSSSSSGSDDYFQVPAGCKAYATGNLLDNSRDGALGGSAANTVGSATVLTAPWDSSSPTLATATGETNTTAVFRYVVSNAGAQPLDQVDSQVRGNVLSLGTSGMLWVSEASTGLGNGGYGVLNGNIPLPDSDGDGMPDVWENAVGLNAASAADGAAVSSSGYTNLEVYINWLTAPHTIVYKNTAPQPTSVDVDLSLYTKGYTGSTTFSVSGAVNGAVSLLADGHTAHFVPTLNFSGLGSYSFSVTDGVSAMTQTVGVVISATAPPIDVTWYGDGTTNAWDTTTADWRSPNNAPIAFGTGDGATFDDTGSTSPAVNLSGSLAPSEVAVSSNTNNYTFSGTGALSGLMPLVKNGNSTLTISNTTANSFSGGALLNGGSVVLGQTAGLGTGGVTLGGVILTLPGTGGTFSNALALNGPSTLNWNSSSNMYLNSTMTGAANLTINFANRLLSPGGNWSAYTGTVDTGTSTGNIRLYNGVALNFGLATFNLGNCRIYHHTTVGQTLLFGALNGNASAVVSGSDSGAAGTDTVSVGALNTNSVFNGTIQNSSTSGLVGLTKTGTGALTLGGTNTYTGPTAVNGGTLVVTGSLGNTAVTVTTGSLLGTGTIGTTAGGTVSMKTGTKISPGLAGTSTFGTLTVGNGLTLNGASVALDLTSNPAGTNDKIALQGGTLTLSGTNTVALNLTDGVLGAGVYNLISGGTATTGSASNLSLGLPTGARQTFTVGTTGGAVTLTVGGTAATLTWQGGQSGGLWNANSTANWSNTGTADKFYNFDAVVFDDTASAGAVNMSGSVQPRSTLFNNSTLAYTLNGPGTLDGGGTLVKNGTGTLTISGYSVVVSGTTTTTSTTVTLTATTGIYTGQLVTGTGIPAGATVASLVDSTHITLSATPTVAGTNNLTFYAVNTYSGGTVINGGTIALGSPAANLYGLGAGAVTLNGGTLTMFSYANNTTAGTLPNALVVNTTGTLNTATRGAISGSLTGSGTLNYNTTYIRTDLSGDWSAFTGQINVTGGGNFRITPSYYYPGFPLAGVNLGDNVAMYFTGIISDTGTSIPIGALSGNASSFLEGGPPGSGARPFSWIVGGKNTNATFAGNITEFPPGTATVTSINKVGTGIWTLSGTSNFNGDMLLQAGGLLVSGSITNGGSFEAQSGTTLQLAGGTLNTASVQIDGGATLSGGGTINGSLSNQGTLLVNGSGGLTVNGDVENDGTMRLTNGSTLAVTGQFINTGVLDLLAGTSSLPANFVNSGGTVLDSSLVRAQSATRAGGVFTVTILGYANHGYQLQSSSSLTAPNWQSVGNVQTVSANASSAVTLTFQDSSTSTGQKFYRIIIAP